MVNAKTGRGIIPESVCHWLRSEGPSLADGHRDGAAHPDDSTPNRIR